MELASTCKSSGKYCIIVKHQYSADIHLFMMSQLADPAGLQCYCWVLSWTVELLLNLTISMFLWWLNDVGDWVTWPKQYLGLLRLDICFSPKRYQTMLWCHKTWLCSLCVPTTSTKSTTVLCGVTALFDTYLETNKHQNLTRLGTL